MSSRVHRLTYTPPPGSERAPRPATPEQVEIAKDRIIPDDTAPEGHRIETEILTLTLADDISPMLLLEMGAVSAQRYGPDDREGQSDFVRLIWDILNEVLPPAEQRKFRRFAKDTGCDIPELISYISQMVGVITGRPTEGQSPSSPGLPETPTGSTEPGEPQPVTSLNGASAL